MIINMNSCNMSILGKVKEFTFPNTTTNFTTPNQITNFYYGAGDGSYSTGALYYVDLDLSSLDFEPKRIRAEVMREGNVLHWEEYIHDFSEEYIIRGIVTYTGDKMACLRLNEFYNPSTKKLKFMVNKKITNETVKVTCYG